MSKSTISPIRPRATRERLSAVRTPVPTGHRSKLGLLILFLLVAGAELVFGTWMNAQGFLWNDGVNRATGALVALFSAQAPQLPSIGFVWMPLPSLVELLWVFFYPLWPGIVSSGFASTFTTALAGGATAVLLLYTARRLGLPERLGWAFALLVATNPMLFLYGSNGMSEGVAAPFLTGAVAFLVLFWRSGQRRYVTAGALALALGFASLYEAVPLGAALFVALVLGILFSSENEQSIPQGHWRAIEGLGLLLLVPSLYVAALWVGANAVIMGDPLFFATSAYSNAGYTTLTDTGVARDVEGDLLATLAFSLKRIAPFLIPGAFLILLRALDGRFWRVNTLSLVLLMLSVSFGLIMPLIYLGDSYGWLRFFAYPLFVAAGWGLYEVSLSRRRRLATTLVLAGWVVAAPVILWAMADPRTGQEENREVLALVRNENAAQVGFDTAAKTLVLDAPVARYLNSMPEDTQVIVDYLKGWAITNQVFPGYLKNVLILTADFRFESAIRDPRAYGISHVLVPNPAAAPNDRVVSSYPHLWTGDEPGFELVESFPDTLQEWRLYKVVAPGTGELEWNDALLSDQASETSDEQDNKPGGLVAERDEATPADSPPSQEPSEPNASTSSVTEISDDTTAVSPDTGTSETSDSEEISGECERAQSGCSMELAAVLGPETEHVVGGGMDTGVGGFGES